MRIYINKVYQNKFTESIITEFLKANAKYQTRIARTSFKFDMHNTNNYLAFL